MPAIEEATHMVSDYALKIAFKKIIIVFNAQTLVGYYVICYQYKVAH